MAELGKINLWRMKDKVEFGKAEKELPNGNHVPDPNFPAVWTMHCAPYRISNRMIIANPTLNNENTIVIAVRHHPNRDYDSYSARYRGNIYHVTYIVPDPSLIVTYDLISLKLVQKNG